MHNSKLFRLLRLLSESERTDYYRFVHALYTDQKSPLVFLDIIWKYLPDLDHPDLSTDNLITSQGLEKFSRKRLLNEANKLSRWLEEFLLWQQLKEPQHKAQRYLLLSEVLDLRGTDNLVEKNNNAFNRHQQSTINQLDNPLFSYQNEFRQYYDTDNKTKTTVQDVLHQQVMYLDYFYLTNRLKACCEEASRVQILQEEAIALDKIVEQLQTIAKFHSEQLPLLYHYYLVVYQLVRHPNKKHYELLNEQLTSNSPLMKEDLSAGLFYLINYNLRFIRQKNPRRGLEQAWKLFERGWTNDWLKTHAYLDEVTLHNVIHIGCGLGKIEQAQKFLDANISQLRPERQPTAQLVAQARIDFANKQYESVVKHLEDLDFADNYHTIQGKVIQMRSYFELSTSRDSGLYDGLLHSLKNSFSTWLSRNKEFAKPIIKSYQNFMSILTQLEKRNWQKVKLQNTLDEMKEVACRDWLQLKIKGYSPISRK